MASENVNTNTVTLRGQHSELDQSVLIIQQYYKLTPIRYSMEVRTHMHMPAVCSVMLDSRQFIHFLGYNHTQDETGFWTVTLTPAIDASSPKKLFIIRFHHTNTLVAGVVLEVDQLKFLTRYIGEYDIDVKGYYDEV